MNLDGFFFGFGMWCLDLSPYQILAPTFKFMAFFDWGIWPSPRTDRFSENPGLIGFPKKRHAEKKARQKYKKARQKKARRKKARHNKGTQGTPFSILKIECVSVGGSSNRSWLVENPYLLNRVCADQQFACPLVERRRWELLWVHLKEKYSHTCVYLKEKYSHTCVAVSQQISTISRCEYFPQNCFLLFHQQITDENLLPSFHVLPLCTLIGSHSAEYFKHDLYIVQSSFLYLMEN